MDKNDVLISFGKRSVFNRIMASFFFSLSLYLCYKRFYLNENYIQISEAVQMRTGMFSIFITIFFGIKFSLNQNIHFNFLEMKFRRYYFIGPIGFGKWQKIRKLDRVSTFLNVREECEVNIWDVRNNKYKIAVFVEIDNAVDYGRDLAKSLKIKFLERN